MRHTEQIEDEHQTNIQEFLDKDHENFSKNKIQVLFSGITKNPPRSEMEKNPKWIEGLTEDTRNDEADRPTMMATPMRTYINPWFQEDKRFIAKMYQELGCMDLFRMTRSCEGHIDDTKNYTVGCGKCWWCYEREWASSVNIDKDPVTPSPTFCLLPWMHVSTSKRHMRTCCTNLPGVQDKDSTKKTVSEMGVMCKDDGKPSELHTPMLKPNGSPT